ncbi:MAG: glucose-1-phosphate cytidylyltransferase [Bacteriovoracaceae bacterium]|nr:glucose-1-phosphate cytidylyltransferase [Bacteriovoracaceae bacterium]
MKVLILAGGYGTRISEESGVRPKPMVEIGDKPILWHIMKQYSHYGFNDFVILLGYKGDVIKEYFFNYYLNQTSVTLDLATNTMETIESKVEPWKVTLLDTGVTTLTGGRIKRAQDIVGNNPFLLTYGDGVSDININNLVDIHEKSKKLITMTAVQPVGKFGALSFDDDNQITSFKEKPKDEAGWINGGFFVCEPKVFDYIEEGDKSIFERAPLEGLVGDGHMNCYKHHGFWKSMDTLADKNSLGHMLKNGEAKWKVW